jgi:hypothetical protein
MKKILLFVCALITPFLLTAQEATGRPNHIHGGFYLKLGPVFPTGDYAKGQSVPFVNLNPPVTQLSYLPAKAGAAMDLGFLIYFGPSFANNYLRAGLDATFLSTWFNSTKPPSDNNKIEKYYSFIGQKFGPVITLNPINRLMLDFSYKINANFGYHDELDGWPLSDSQTSEYGYNLFSNEVSLGIRYSILLFSLEYNFGTMNYNDGKKDNQDQEIDVNTFRLLFGLKF